MVQIKLKEKRILLAKRIARKYIQKIAKAEYRFDVFYSTIDSGKVKRLPELLRSFRDGKVKIENIPYIPDLGMEEALDKITLWSADGTLLRVLHQWLEGKGLETTGLP